MKDISIHTDLACERCRADDDCEGVSFEKKKVGDTEIHTLSITSKAASEKHKMAIGSYTTLVVPPLWDIDGDELNSSADALTEVLSDYLKKALSGRDVKGSKILVVGLGNRYLTADAVGPMTVKQISATNHISEYESDVFTKYFHAKVITVSPGVMSQTGIESADIIRGICELAKPDATIVIDALAARSCERLATTIQLCDTGISPGSGINNTRLAMNEHTLGCPTIAIGVPTVVDSATLVLDALEKAQCESYKDGFFENLQEKSFFVSPKDCDAVTENASHIISSAINSLLNKDLFKT